MKITSEVLTTTNNPDGRKYPYIGRYRGINCERHDFAVLFYSPCHGIVIYDSSDSYRIGYVHSDWIEGQFDVFYGTIKLKS